MADIIVYSDKPQVACELAFKGKELAGALGLGLSAAALGAGAAAQAADLGAHGADRIYVCEDAALKGLQSDVVAEALAQVAAEAGAEYVLLGSTRRGKELAGRLAQKLAAGAVTDCNAMYVADGALVGCRYALGGATVAEERIDTPVKVFAVMPKAFAVEGPQAGRGEVVSPSLALTPSKVALVDRKPKEGETVDLAAAPIILGIGRGFGKREDLQLANDLAVALGAELGCTKSLADFEWLPEDRIIGLSGAKTTPDFYLCAGISGQVQHTVGISQSKLIAAINSDKEAPIFQLADYGIVGDLYQVIPALVEKLKSM
jgi:electron transfer flavoprotein alpha subunit